MKYRKGVSLSKNKDFQNVYKNGKSSGNRLLVMYTLKNGLDINRLGITVSKKVGNSVVRHRITRLIRESYRLNEEKFSSGLDIVVVARKNSKDKSFEDIKGAFMHLAALRGVVKKDEVSDDKNDQVLSEIPVTP